MTTFPKDFLWSASTAATQIEGGWNADGKGSPSGTPWSMTAPARSPTARTPTSPLIFTTGWREDVALMKQMGLKAYRFSISWARVLPRVLARSTRRASDFTRISATSC